LPHDRNFGIAEVLNPGLDAAWRVFHIDNGADWFFIALRIARTVIIGLAYHFCRVSSNRVATGPLGMQAMQHQIDSVEIYCLGINKAHPRLYTVQV